MTKMHNIVFLDNTIQYTNNMAIAMRGLKVKPPYEQLIGVESPDGLEQIEFPNRDEKILRDGFIPSQLDGEGMRQMQLQQAQASK